MYHRCGHTHNRGVMRVTGVMLITGVVQSQHVLPCIRMVERFLELVGSMEVETFGLLVFISWLPHLIFGGEHLDRALLEQIRDKVLESSPSAFILWFPY